VINKTIMGINRLDTPKSALSEDILKRCGIYEIYLSQGSKQKIVEELERVICKSYKGL